MKRPSKRALFYPLPYMWNNYCTFQPFSAEDKTQASIQSHMTYLYCLNYIFIFFLFVEPFPEQNNTLKV